MFGLLEVGLHTEGLGQKGRPVARQEVSALHFNSQAGHLQLLPQEGLLIEVVPSDEDEGRAMTQALRGGAVPYLAQHAVCRIDLQARSLSVLIAHLSCSQHVHMDALLTDAV